MLLGRASLIFQFHSQCNFENSPSWLSDVGFQYRFGLNKLYGVHYSCDVDLSKLFMKSLTYH